MEAAGDQAVTRAPLAHLAAAQVVQAVLEAAAALRALGAALCLEPPPQPSLEVPVSPGVVGEEAIRLDRGSAGTAEAVKTDSVVVVAVLAVQPLDWEGWVLVEVDTTRPTATSLAPLPTPILAAEAEGLTLTWAAGMEALDL